MSLSDNADPKVASSTPHATPTAPAPQQGRARRRRALTAFIAALAVVVTVAAAGGLVWQIAAVTGPPTGTFTPPEAYPPAEPEPVLATSNANAPLPDLASIMPALLDDPRLDGSTSASFADALTGEILFEQEGTTPLAPASSMKVVTAVAAFQHLGAEYRIPTTVVEGPTEDSVVLVAGGDPTLTIDGEGYYTDYAAGASLTELASLVLEARGGEVPSTVYLDTSVFTDSVNAAGVTMYELLYSTGPMAPIMVDGGRIHNDQKYSEHLTDPAMAAAREFAEILGASEVAAGTAAADAAELAVVHSAPMAALVDSFILTSDNLLSDAVALQTALVVEGEMTWAAMAAVHQSTLQDMGVDTTGLVFNDGSGLSPTDRMTASAFTQLLLSATSSQAASVFESLPVAGYSGTLDDRFGSAEEGQGVVRAKTGTLTEPSVVISLTGTLTTADGRQLIFSLMSNGTTSGEEPVEAALDEISAAVSQCGC
ncbi:D-alanyl-D-alanine carboxypeptidase/D-alanyl-D-alanine-endopeptidase [Glycomyces sp. TRM65418]|uniref:D-alanyl-D-alanine carboxypeptidase/D-alanyl-D-alanine endopeptidase n=1 Tax=Glycomyces sp. TRM65418 TaxID=2867006 RepID=UPI001CE5C41E|nr:D-alanyl-D-alanine carboxypeptidase/D-alanyl-D-alanine-endopeptidase [Glycomyces sp. TRM65418]MCC3762544.1 D-alanyl-D-alanine carboxypeptidase/D-alanyl-D-alanine-endopeptidase [Glycomyces sp. TRM65418]QZD56583.1 D-alanyl-D-alanine carboxypeptidase/D-alanyl-D-alanine-endopeptidase [Glycomyces sp. TRM65418]